MPHLPYCLCVAYLAWFVSSLFQVGYEMIIDLIWKSDFCLQLLFSIFCMLHNWSDLLFGSSGRTRSLLQHLCGLCFIWLRFVLIHIFMWLLLASTAFIYISLGLYLICFAKNLPLYSIMTDVVSMILLSRKLMRPSNTLCEGNLKSFKLSCNAYISGL